MRRPFNFTLLLFSLFAFGSCKKDKIDGAVITDPAFASQLMTSPEAMIIGNDSLLLTTYAGIDEMPRVGSSDDDGSGIGCGIYLTYRDSLPITAGIKLTKLYVIYNGMVWTSQLTQYSNPPTVTIQGGAENGPKNFGGFVDVVCEFEMNNITYRIIAKHQEVHISI